MCLPSSPSPHTFYLLTLHSILGGNNNNSLTSVSDTKRPQTPTTFTSCRQTRTAFFPPSLPPQSIQNCTASFHRFLVPISRFLSHFTLSPYSSVFCGPSHAPQLFHLLIIIGGARQCSSWDGIMIPFIPCHPPYRPHVFTVPMSRIRTIKHQPVISSCYMTRALLDYLRVL